MASKDISLCALRNKEFEECPKCYRNPALTPALNSHQWWMAPVILKSKNKKDVCQSVWLIVEGK